MTIHGLLQLVASSMLINNIVFVLLIGFCPLCGTSRRFSGAAWMGIAVTIVMGATSASCWTINRYVLVPHGVQYLHTLVFILVIVSLVQLLEMVLEKFFPWLYESIGIFLPVISTNCSVLAICLLGVGANPVTGRPFSFVEASVNGVAAGAGFMLALVLISGVQHRLELSNVPAAMKGLPIIFLSAGLISLAFLGFAGLSFTPSFGG
jgi:electron transport complex protein RnfA